jgi:hypothetical protein
MKSAPDLGGWGVLKPLSGGRVNPAADLWPGSNEKASLLLDFPDASVGGRFAVSISPAMNVQGGLPSLRRPTSTPCFEVTIAATTGPRLWLGGVVLCGAVHDTQLPPQVVDVPSDATAGGHGSATDMLQPRRPRARPWALARSSRHYAAKADHHCGSVVLIAWASCLAVSVRKAAMEVPAMRSRRGLGPDAFGLRVVLQDLILCRKTRCWPASVSLTWAEYRPLHDGTSMRADCSTPDCAGKLYV